MDDLHRELVKKDGAYAAWHRHPFHAVAHWAFFIFVSFGAAFILLQSIALVNRSFAAGQQWVVGYYVSYGSSSYPPSSVDYSSLTHIAMFSVWPHSDGSLDTTFFIDSTNGPKVAVDVASRAHNAGKKALLVVGGSGVSDGFAGALGSANRIKFEQNLLNAINSWGYDGIDWDPEPLPSASYSDFIAVLNDLRAAKPGMINTLDVDWVNNNFGISSTDALFYNQVAPLLDRFNIMTYYMADNWGGWVSWHSSPLQGEGSDHPSSVKSSAAAYIAAGIPASKIDMGIGAYGSCWSAPTTAPLQSLGSSHVVADDNSMSVTNIANIYYTPSAYHYDTNAQAPYLSYASAYGPQGCTFISYEDATSLAAKGAYSQQNGLGGTIIWQMNEAYNPQASDPQGFLHSVYQAFNGTLSGGTPPPPSNGDTTPPTISLSYPVDGSNVSRRSTITIAANASDDVAVAKVEFYINTKLACTDTTASYSCQWKVPSTPNKTYTIMAKAYDTSGNTAQSSVKVTAR